MRGRASIHQQQSVGCEVELLLISNILSDAMSRYYSLATFCRMQGRAIIHQQYSVGCEIELLFISNILSDAMLFMEGPH